MCFEIAMLAGAALSGGGALMAGSAQRQQANYGAKVAEANATTARMQGASEAERLQLRTTKLQGEQAANAAASGVNPNAGSAALIINQDTGRNAFLDQASAIWNSENAATGFENQAKGLKLQGKNAQTASYIQAPASFLTGLGGSRKRSGSDALSLE